jgi:hypothetical protein
MDKKLAHKLVEQNMKAVEERSCPVLLKPASKELMKDDHPSDGHIEYKI